MSMYLGIIFNHNPSREIIAKYINKYGDNVQNSNESKLSEQIQKYPKLYDLLELDENYDL